MDWMWGQMDTGDKETKLLNAADDVERGRIDIGHLFGMMFSDYSLLATKHEKICRLADSDGLTVAHLAARWEEAAIKLVDMPLVLELRTKYGLKVEHIVKNTLENSNCGESKRALTKFLLKKCHFSMN